jgi:hypothetical protein
MSPGRLLRLGSKFLAIPVTPTNMHLMRQKIAYRIVYVAVLLLCLSLAATAQEKARPIKNLKPTVILISIGNVRWSSQWA